RKGNRWESTRDTAWILFALADYLKTTGELKPDYHLSVLLNGKEIHAEDVKPGDNLKDDLILRVPLEELQPANRLELRKQGEGAVYYALKVTQRIKAAGFAPETPVPGLTLQRQYFQVETRRDSAGRLVVGPAKHPTTSARVGDRLLVRLKIR